MKTVIAKEALTGIYHLEYGIECQDAVAGIKGETVAAVALCDGAGSCPESGKAARAISSEMPSILSESFEVLYALAEKRRREEFAELLLGLMKKRETLQNYWNDKYLTTLLFAAAHKDGRWITGHIGDGVILAANELNVQTLSQPENGGASWLTWFINGSENETKEHTRFRCGKAKRMLTFLLSSDGCENLLIAETGAPSSLAVDMIRWPETMEEEAVQMMLSRRMERRYSSFTDDDMSIVIMHNEVIGNDTVNPGGKENE